MYERKKDNELIILEDIGETKESKYYTYYHQYFAENPNLASFYNKHKVYDDDKQDYNLLSSFDNYVVATLGGDDQISLDDEFYDVRINLGLGNDIFKGGGGNDSAFGNIGSDELHGNKGNDATSL